MQIIAREDIERLPRCDVQLGGIEWLADMSLRLALILPDGHRARLLATFAHQVRIAVQFEERTGGFPLTWDTTYSELADGSWHVLMDFAHTGSVEFNCSELYFEYVTNAA